MKSLTYPRQGTNASRYLARFLNGEKLKHREADEAAGSYRLSGYVHYLKSKHGWPITRRELQDDTGDPIGRTAIFTEYWLDSSILKYAGQVGHEYSRAVLGWETEKVASRVAATTLNAKIDRPRKTAIDKHTTMQIGKCLQGED